MHGVAVSADTYSNRIPTYVRHIAVACGYAGTGIKLTVLL